MTPEPDKSLSSSEAPESQATVWKEGVQGSGPAISKQDVAPKSQLTEAEDLAAARAIVWKVLYALSGWDWDEFSSSLHPEAVVFREPDVETPAGQEEPNLPAVTSWLKVQSDLERLFKEYRAQEKRLVKASMRPANLDIEIKGNITVVNLKQDRKGAGGQRALVLARTDGGWVVRHLHASVLGLPVETAG